MADLIVAGIILAIVVLAVMYIVKAKKSGVKCIGCPAGGQCAHHKHNAQSECSCGCHEDTKS